MGTNTDPYQRAEGKYQLMPGIIGALVERAVPFSILTKGTLLRRDLDVLAAAAEVVDVHLALSIAIFDEELQQSIEPGTPTTAARLATVRAIRERGMECTVLFAPILPFLTDDDEHLDLALTELKAAGVTNVLHTLLYLREGVKPWFMSWVADAHPELVADYEDLFGTGANARPGYRKQLNERVTKLLRKHGYRRETDPGRGRRAAAKLALDRRGSVARPAASEPTLF
jgi:DNA repair photolyase